MEELVKTLHEGGYSCVIRQGDVIRTFTQRGVSDLYALLTKEPHFLLGASVADKVIGKAAAALLVAGGIKELHAGVISEGALELLTQAGIPTTYDKRVPYIINRTHTDRCPLEKRCAEATSAAECLPLIASFVEEVKLRNHV